MEAKLIKKSENYYELYEVRTNLTLLIGSTDSERKIDVYGKDAHKLLSIKNCEAIANGYDLDELADENYQNFWNILDYKERDIHTFGFIEGFQKALEILGDKKFSEEDVKKAMDVAVNYETNRDAQSYQEKIDFLKSLQQTEWDVEILEIENDEVYSVSENMKVAHNKAFDGVLFKYDADGCLILKRK